MQFHNYYKIKNKYKVVELSKLNKLKTMKQTLGI